MFILNGENLSTMLRPMGYEKEGGTWAEGTGSNVRLLTMPRGAQVHGCTTVGANLQSFVNLFGFPLDRAPPCAEACQTLIVQIIHRILPTLAVDDVEHFMALVARLIAAQSFGAVLSETTRSWVYDIWVWLYDNRPHDLARHLPRLTRLLLSGLSDASLAIRTKVLEFWNHETRLPLDAMARLERLFVDLYDDARGEAWLQYAAYLLLKLTQVVGLLERSMHLMRGGRGVRLHPCVQRMHCPTVRSDRFSFSDLMSEVPRLGTQRCVQRRPLDSHLV